MMSRLITQIVASHSMASQASLYYEEGVDQCPYCLRSMGQAPDQIKYTLPINKIGSILFCTYQCKQSQCQKVFLGEYTLIFDSTQKPSTHFYRLRKLIPAPVKKQEWSEEIKNHFPNFIEIYDQALMAETHGLNHASGPAYRKALEYLVKEYCIHKEQNNAELIKKKFLGNCIKDHISDTNVKSCAERAAWLGNDETHFERTWVDQDLTDLKKLIRLTAIHIESEILTNHYTTTMPK